MGTLFRRAAACSRRAHRFIAEPLERRTLLSLELVKDINTDTGPSDQRNLTESGGLLFFTAQDARGIELWKTDGTAAGTAGPAAGGRDRRGAVGNRRYAGRHADGG